MVTGSGVRGPGRRPGAPDTRGQILSAARTAFADKGFERTTVRGVAAAAGVAPGLVHHFFGAKEDLFLAALAVPFDPRVVLAPVADGPPDDLGRGLARTFVDIWEDERRRESLLALLRGAMTSPPVATMLREGFMPMAVGALGRAVAAPDPAARIQLALAQLLGMATLRYAVRVEPLASMPPDEVVNRLAPALQLHLRG
ncbi:MAG: TetR/AcrR family transcriptional regulator [Nocardioidaceae bacterium]|nr:TetR/AcrR family transcriptional regulator [Nocardioidaceae bacterium]